MRKPLAETNLKRVVIARQEAVIQERAVGSAEIGERKSGNAGTGGRGIELLDAGEMPPERPYIPQREHSAVIEILLHLKAEGLDVGCVKMMRDHRNGEVARRSAV